MTQTYILKLCFHRRVRHGFLNSLLAVVINGRDNENDNDNDVVCVSDPLHVGCLPPQQRSEVPVSLKVTICVMLSMIEKDYMYVSVMIIGQFRILMVGLDLAWNGG